MRLEAKMLSDEEFKDIFGHRDNRFKFGKTTKATAGGEAIEEDVKMDDVREGEASASASGSSSATPPAVPTTPGPSTRPSGATQSTPIPAAADRSVHQPPTTEPESKRQRISLIESSVKNVIGQLLRQDISEAGQLCKKETFKKIIESFSRNQCKKHGKAQIE